MNCLKRYGLNTVSDGYRKWKFYSVSDTFFLWAGIENEEFSRIPIPCIFEGIETQEFSRIPIP